MEARARNSPSRPWRAKFSLACWPPSNRRSGRGMSKGHSTLEHRVDAGMGRRSVKLSKRVREFPRKTGEPNESPIEVFAGGVLKNPPWDRARGGARRGI